ncbi:MAG: cytochrome c553 [Methylophagaceae bacterium]|jgi:cytochrome c553
MKKWWKAIVASLAAIALPVMAAGSIDAGKAKAGTCIECHGVGGNSTQPMFPKLAGQGEGYLFKQLMDFASGGREGPFMSGIVQDLDKEDMADLAAYFASTTHTRGATSDILLAEGQKLYRGGNKETGVPACMACHGPSGGGIPAAKWPSLSGQHIAYTETQLTDFANGIRHNDINGMMQDIAAKMSENERKSVSAYISGLH